MRYVRLCIVRVSRIHVVDTSNRTLMVLRPLLQVCSNRTLVRKIPVTSKCITVILITHVYTCVMHVYVTHIDIRHSELLQRICINDALHMRIGLLLEIGLSLAFDPMLVQLA